MAKKSKNLSIIDSDLKVDGNIISKGKLLIKGTVKGKIEGEIVIITPEGTVFSEASVRSMTIGGMFEGQINATEELVVLSTGTCAGKITCKDLVVENGGILNADVTCKSAKNMNSKLPEPDPPKGKLFAKNAPKEPQKQKPNQPIELN